MCASCIERLPTGPVQHQTSFSPSRTTVKRSDCQSAKHAHGPRPLLELRRTAFRPLPMKFASKGTTAFGLVPALYHQTGDAGLPFLLIAIAAIAFSRGRLSARHPTANPQEAATNRVLLMAGIAAVVVYVIGDLLSAVMYDGYSYIDQAISELSAFGSPVRPLPPFVHTHSHDPCSAAGLPHVARTPGRHPSRTWKRAFCWQPLQSGPRARREAAGGNEPVDATIVAGEQLGDPCQRCGRRSLSISSAATTTLHWACATTC